MPTQRSIATQYWTSPAIHYTKPTTKLLGTYCLTGPRSNFGGLFVLSWDDASDYTGLTAKQIDTGLEELGQVQPDGDPFLRYDPATRLVWIVKRILHEFPRGKMGSGPQRDGMRKILEACPPCQLLLQAVERYLGLDELFATFAEALRKRLGQGSGQGLPQGLAEPLSQGSVSGSLLPASGSLLSTTASTGKPAEGDGHGEIREILDHHRTCFVRLTGAEPNGEPGKDHAIVKRLLSRYGKAKLLALMDAFFESTDPFIVRSGWTIGVFGSQINKLLAAGNGRTGRAALNNKFAGRPSGLVRL